MEITIAKKLYHLKISGRREQLGPYPMERLKRVERPRTRIIDDIPRSDERECGFACTMRGDFGPRLAREFERFINKHPLEAALASMVGHMIPLVKRAILACK